MYWLKIRVWCGYVINRFSCVDARAGYGLTGFVYKPLFWDSGDSKIDLCQTKTQNQTFYDHCTFSIPLFNSTEMSKIYY